MEDASIQINSNALIAALGLSTDCEQVARLFKEGGIRKPKGEKEDFYDESIVWYPKHAVRVDLFRGHKFSKLSCRQIDVPAAWYIGEIQFLARGADDRIKSSFPGILPCGLRMNDNPIAFIHSLGTPHLDDVLVWPGYRGRLLAWRTEGSCTAITFESDAPDSTVLSYSSCVLGCAGAWTETWPAIFAPNAA